MLQSLRLWNRAIDTLTRLNPSSDVPPKTTDESNPFQVSSLTDVLPTEQPTGPSKELSPPKKTFTRRPSSDGLEWRISEGLLSTLFSLSQAYLNRGSVREAEYFAQQAQDLAESLNAPTMVSRALARKGEIQLYQGHFEVSLESLVKAGELLENTPGIDNVDIRRLRGIYNERMAQHMDANELYEETLNMIEEFDQAFRLFDGLNGYVFFHHYTMRSLRLLDRRMSIGSSPNTNKTAKEVLLPEMLAAVLRQRSTSSIP